MNPERKNHLKIIRYFILTSLGVASLCSIGLGLFVPTDTPRFKGGMVSIDGSPQGAGQTWINDSQDNIYDSLIKGLDGQGGTLNPSSFDITISVDGEAKSWSTINGFNQTNYKKKVTSDPGKSCMDSQQITVETPDNVGSLDIWFTNKYGYVIREAVNIYSATGATQMLTLPPGDGALGEGWSLCLKNKTNYLIIGFTFSESPNALTLTGLHSSRLGSTSTATKNVTFEFPLAAQSGYAVVGAKYNATPAQETVASCTVQVSKVIPESAAPRHSFTAGTGVSVPNITLREVDAGAIDIQGGEDEIVLLPKHCFEFDSAGSLTVSTGNIQLGTPYLSNGEIHIQILTPSFGEGKSTIQLSGLTINTLTGLREGTIVLRLKEPMGNDSNFPYAYFHPEE